MFPPLTVRTRLAAVTSLPDRWSVRLRDMAGFGHWIAGIVVVSFLVLWVSGRAWPGIAAGMAGMVLMAWRSVKMLEALRAALERTERDRASLEQALAKSQKMEALGRLAVGVAHDFNNHLTVISSNVEMMARRLDTSQKGLRRHVDAAMQGVQRAAVLTGRLLSFSRQPAPEPEMVDVNRLLNGLADILRRTLGDRVELEVVLSAEPWFVWADVNQMEHAVLSLVVTTSDQVRDGARLKMTVSNTRLDEVFVIAHPSVAAGEYVELAIDASVATHERRKWHLANDLDSAELSMARAFIRQSGGMMLRAGGTMDGLSLRVFLPRHLSPAPIGIPRRGPSGRQTILVVEDDDRVRMSCVEILRALDYEVLEAPDAMEAFRLITDRGGIDLLLTDIGLPGGVNGRALADAARNVDAGLRVLFTTGYENVDLPDGVRASLLRKPFKNDELAVRVRAALTTDPAFGQSATVRG